MSFMESNVYSLYTDPELAISRIKNRSLQLKLMGSWSEINVIDKIHMVFISGMEPLLRSDSIVRLKHEQARNFYKMFVDDIHRLSLKEHIEKTVAYFYKIKNEAKGREFYIGTSYGDKFIKKENGEYSKKAYIDLSRLNHKQLVNIALVKIKIESDFLSFVINEYVKLLFDLSLIDENEYNIFVYGTPKKSSSVLKQLGLSGSLLSKLEADNQIGNIGVDENGCLQFNDLFRVYISQQDDFVQFEINKFASL